MLDYLDAAMDCRRVLCDVMKVSISNDLFLDVLGDELHHVCCLWAR